MKEFEYSTTLVSRIVLWVPSKVELIQRVPDGGAVQLSAWISGTRSVTIARSTRETKQPPPVAIEQIVTARN